jgi:hypothetical protein
LPRRPLEGRDIDRDLVLRHADQDRATARPFCDHKYQALLGRIDRGEAGPSGQKGRFRRCEVAAEGNFRVRTLSLRTAA